MHGGHTLAIALWAMTAMSFGFVALRLYTRVVIVRFVGIEDHLYAMTGFLLLIFAACIQVAVHHGLGQSLWTLEPDNQSDAIFWTYIANTFAITGNAASKLCMGFFLLRVVQLKGQKAALWILIIVTVGTSATLIVMLWNQTTPRKASWDPLRTMGVWNLDILPMNVGLGAWSSACDFFFAIFPWLFIMSLRMPKREKILLASSMSLGVIAGSCGMVRTFVLSKMGIDDFTLNFAPYFIWAGAEIAVSMICLGIPTLRPLYLRHHGRTTIGYGNHHHTDHSDPELPRFTMIDRKSSTRRPPPDIYGNLTPESQLSYSELATKQEQWESDRDQQSESEADTESDYLRDSNSSHTMVEGELFSIPEEEEPEEDIIARPSSALLKTEKRMSDNDSVYDILGLYDERSQSRSRSRTPDPRGRGASRPRTPFDGGNGSFDLERGLVWRNHETLRVPDERDHNWPLRS
ncbi:hypothetical protein QBC35DRAFT_412650 [Podospora australis]|uniref:Rhodopsin domain-containing protein n=1 Tax=Podospora australis TaxID=1536484 RepID=A0AAN6WR24_9PEZI|nr:hypothetical protein QBC35DRAFT_412650 [Podospora australis]